MVSCSAVAWLVYQILSAFELIGC